MRSMRGRAWTASPGANDRTAEPRHDLACHVVAQLERRSVDRAGRFATVELADCRGGRDR
jgi:hypothetical protein